MMVNYTLNYEFGISPPVLVICSKILSHDAGQQSQPQLLASHMTTKVNN